MESMITAWRTPMSSEKQASLNVLPRREPRDEQLRLPRSTKRKSVPFNVSTAAPDPTFARSPRTDSPGSACSPGSPKVIEYQAGAGASRRRGDSIPWSNYAAHKPLNETAANDQRSEFSLSILDYYLSPLPSPAFPSSTSSGMAKDQAMAAFDFGLDDLPISSTRSSQANTCRTIAPKPYRDFSTNRSLPTTPSQYSLFPRFEPADMQQPVPPVRLHTLQMPSTAPSSNSNTSHRASLPPAVRPRTNSCGSVHFSPSAATSTQNAGRYLRRPPPFRTTITTNTSSAATAPTSPPAMHRASIATASGRWSGDTVTPSLDSPSGSKSTSTQGRSSTSSSASQPWPLTGSMWEESDDEEVPLRRKVARKFSRASASTVDTTTRAAAGRQSSASPGWFRRWVLCSSCGGDGG